MAHNSECQFNVSLTSKNSPAMPKNMGIGANTFAKKMRQ